MDLIFCLKNCRTIASVLVLGLFFANSKIEAQEVKLDDVWLNYKYYDRGFDHIQWANNDSSMFFIAAHDSGYSYIISQDTRTGITADTVLGKSNDIHLNFSDFTFSPDRKYLLLETAYEGLYRRSGKAYYVLYSLEKKSLDTIFTQKQFNPTFSPDSKHIAFTADNNLYSYTIQSKIVNQLTTDGDWNHILNGRSDWVYEEEFEFTQAYVWKADSKGIAYLKFDESEVKEYQMQLWGNSLYPTLQTFKYPKAGEKNSELQVMYVDVQTKESHVLLDETGKDTYIARIMSTPNPDLIAVIRMNRLQNELELLHINVSTGQISKIYNESSDTYVEINNEVKYLNQNTLLLTSEQSGYNHIYLYDFSGKEVAQLTHGAWEVDEIVGIDENRQWVYFTSTEVSPLERQVYRVDFSGENKEVVINEHGVNSAELSTNGRFIVGVHSSIIQPHTTSLYTATGKMIRILESNANVKKALSEVSVQYPEFFTFPTEGGEQLNGYLITPSDFKKKKKYPVLVYVYGGPGHQTVMNEWGSFNFMWFQTLLDKGYVIVSIDGRGTGGRGADFKKQTYGDLGDKETADLIALAKYLGDQSFVDKDRIGIWGWSFGGYLTALALTKGAEYYKLGVAVAPVTNWRFYDTIYTERYLGLPADNTKGYDFNSPINYAGELKGKLLLIHGTGDDNVHIQNQTAFQNALIKANKQFDAFNYPDRNHGIYGGVTRYHLYQKMTDYIINRL